ncbi:MAG: diguanylate cyclase [Motiliproteus sp.]|nr:diguanylate cyclase [Motiliproteus sp.]
MSRRLRRLLQVSNEVAAGNFDIQISNPAKDKLGALEFSFNTMGQKIHKITKQLLERKEELQEAQHLSKIGAWQWHIDEQQVHFSKESLNILSDFEPAEWMKVDDLQKHFGSQQLAQFQDMISLLLAGGTVNEVYRLETKSGNEIFLRLRAKNTDFRQAKAFRVAGTLQDVTIEMEAQKAKEEKQKIYFQMFYKDPTIKLLIDPNNGHIVDANPAALEFYGYSEEAIKQIDICTINQLPIGQCREKMALAIKEEENVFSFQHRLASGEIRDVELHSCPVSFEAKTYLHSTIFDVTKRNQLQQQLEDAALHDPLTSLWNRRAIDTQGEREFLLTKRNNTQLSLLMIDLDYFKNINDQYGHPIGDLVLKKSAINIESVVRETDLVARYGGEEFMVLAPNTNLEGARLLADKVLDAIRQTSLKVQDRSIEVTASIGISSVSATDQSFYQLIERSDKQLYVAKEAGRNRIQGDAQPGS